MITQQKLQNKITPSVLNTFRYSGIYREIWFALGILKKSSKMVDKK